MTDSESSMYKTFGEAFESFHKIAAQASGLVWRIDNHRKKKAWSPCMFTILRFHWLSVKDNPAIYKIS